MKIPIFSERAKSVFKRIAWPVILITLLPYGCDAFNRSGASSCKREVFEIYIGETCYLPTEFGMLFRLYDARDGALLAERTYLHPEPRLMWFPDHVLYDVAASDGKGWVDFPPTLWDRIKAHLP